MYLIIVALHLLTYIPQGHCVKSVQIRSLKITGQKKLIWTLFTQWEPQKGFGTKFS